MLAERSQTPLVAKVVLLTVFVGDKLVILFVDSKRGGIALHR